MAEEQIKTEEQEKKDRKSAVLAVSMKRKGIILIATFALLIALVIMGTAAWYTKVSDVSGITMKVAEFDFNANFQSDDFQVNAFDFAQVEEYEAAPGAGGCIPIVVSSSDSAVDVNYTIALNFSDMAPEFKARLMYYYYVETGGAIQKIIINPGRPGDSIKGQLDENHNKKTEYLYWDWVYSLTPNLYYEASTGTWVEDDSASYDEASGKWVFADGDNGAKARRFKAAVLTSSGIYNPVPTTIYSAIDYHDDLDTLIGLGKCNQVFTSAAIDPNTRTFPRIYEEKLTTMSAVSLNHDGTPSHWETYQTTISAVQQAMEVRIMITGGQARPDANLTNPAIGMEGTSKFITR